ncbi:DNA topoisomerase IV subunit A [Candidatus Fermentibacterales bacterium]|nr:DNA topoisomerase IV subunit A [Candidatus Fermentibacterales bacterium]
MPKSELYGLYEKNFLDYASYVIQERAIPEASDGLKPVQRRILWSLKEMDDGRLNKVANVIGHCMRYHPHGDQSIGSALVSLASRGFFIETQGNFGNILTGDEASAPRYIECRLTQLARDVLFDDDLTEFVDSYDGRNREPVVLPARLPVLLLLGAEGIAVGMSTRILPHNFCEVIRAQIAVLQEREFSLLPDFPQGGIMDASDYQDGNGRVRIRARIERKDDKRLVIRELPWSTTTETLLASIEAAAKKGRIKLSSIEDFTTDSVEIQITLGRGIHTDEGVDQLYAHTDCEITISPSMLVIQEGRPIQTTVPDLLRYNTDLLLYYLRRQLEIRLERLQERFFWMTLEQIYVENRLYKEIEECGTWDEVVERATGSLEPFAEQLPRPVTPEDIDRLLALRLRRITRFDIEKHRKDIREVKGEIRKTRAHLKDVKAYATGFLEKLLEDYGDRFTRRTSIEELSDIDTQEIALKNLRLSYDPESGFVGTSVRGERTLAVSEYDRVIIFDSSGTYRVLPIEDKTFVDVNIVHFDIYDRDRVYAVVHREEESRLACAKRFSVGGAIMGKEYRYFPEGCSLMLFSANPESRLEYWFERRKRQRTFKGSTELSDLRLLGASASGSRLAGTRVISSIKEIEPRPEQDDERAEPGAGETEGEDRESGAEEPPREEKPAEEPSSPEDSAEEPVPETRPDVSGLLARADRLAKRAHRVVEAAERGEQVSDLFDDPEDEAPD